MEALLHSPLVKKHNLTLYETGSMIMADCYLSCHISKSFFTLKQIFIEATKFFSGRVKCYFFFDIVMLKVYVNLQFRKSSQLFGN